MLSRASKPPAPLARSIWQCNNQPELFYPVSDLAHLHFDSVCCSLPAPSIPYPAHSCSLKRCLLTTKGAAKKKKRGEKKQPKANKQKRRKLLNYAWLCFIKDFMARLQYHFSLERSEDRFIYSLPHSCVQSNRKHVPLDKRLSIFKNVQRTQALLPLALEKCPFECSCCWSWEDCARLSA